MTRGALLALALAFCVLPAAAAPAPRRLIEFGWDEPYTDFLRAHITQMERTPFDGCVFLVDYKTSDGSKGCFSSECWGARPFTPLDLQPALDDLKATRFRRFKHNFLRFDTTPGNVDWFDDHSAVLNNARLAARVARDGGCAGILFDIEQYEGQLFDYRKQRDTGRRSWDEYAAQVRRRGREVMEAFQEGYPDLTVFLTYGYCLPWVHSEGRLDRLPDTDYGLLAPFMDGLVDGAAGSTKLVDGFELSYGYRKPEEFASGYRLVKQGLLPMVANPERYRKYCSMAFAVWMDNDWRRHGWDTRRPGKNYFTPAAFGTSVRAALATTDEYVWIYTESPRWWSEGGTPVKLPATYDAALRRARAGARTVPAHVLPPEQGVSRPTTSP